MITNTYQNNTNETADDKNFINKVTLACTPTNWTPIKGFRVVNHHAGREVAKLIDTTISQVRRTKNSANKKIVSVLQSNPTAWIGTREAMAVVHCNEPHGHTADDMNIVFGIVRRCIKNKEPLPDDVARIIERDLGKYQDNYWKNRNTEGDFMPNKHMSLDQAFGIEKTKAQHLDPYVISDTALDLVEEMLFGIHLNKEHEPIAISLNEAMRSLNDKEEDVDTGEGDKDNDGEMNKMKIKHKSKYVNHFKTYKFPALDYILRRKLVHEKSHRIKLSDEQIKMIKKNWGVNMPKELRFIDEDYVKQLLAVN